MEWTLIAQTGIDIIFWIIAIYVIYRVIKHFVKKFVHEALHEHEEKMKKENIMRQVNETRAKYG